MVDIEVLRNHPTDTVINNVFTELLSTTFHGEDRNADLDLGAILLILQYVVPIYPSLGKDTKQTLQHLLSRSFLFLSQLVSFSASLVQERSTSPRQSNKSLYGKLLIDTLSKEYSCLTNYILFVGRSRLQVNNLKSLFFGSKIFNLISSDIDIIQYIQIMKSQWKSYIDSKGDLQTFSTIDGELLVSSFTLNQILTMDIILGELFLTTTPYLAYFKSIVRSATPLDQQRLINKYLLKFLEPRTNMNNYYVVYAIVSSGLPLNSTIDLDALIALRATVLQEIIVRSLTIESIMKMLPLEIARFGEVNEETDEVICLIFVMFLKFHINKDGAIDIMSHNSDFLDAVTKRLAHKDRIIRERTMFVAKLASRNKLEYESDFTIEIPDLKLNVTASSTTDFSLLNEHDGRESDSQSVEVVSAAVGELVLDDGNVSDSDDEDSDDSSNKNINDIVFIKDLVKELEMLDNNNHRNSFIPLLKKSIKLVRQKRHFPLEVEYYCTALLSSITLMNNNFDESQFEGWRVNALVSLLVVVPEKVTELYKLFLNSELSLQQRMSVLTSLGLAARELRGFDDKNIVKPQYDFPTSRLPWDKPSTETNVSLIEDLSGTTEETSLLRQSKTVWKSKKLEKGSKIQEVNRFRKYASLFFFPLAHTWLNGIDMGTFDILFKTHYISTLRIIYTCANPVHDYESMTLLMERIMQQAEAEGVVALV
ncbi:Tel2p NDAI_0G01200 [Naumovozyma dairenensis CBS 421]|uniref:Telomere length regulation protein conserved domain-containing protein n=1 Tax=Naumovozyma dairenensis (strain ATCC 10597 / BCRC 20456 / CBS 421 / NBRC 0211 / NRRL Y-12639) TaxID=1071378 RepID=G0WDN5_NAUDC|nr:hypothetical protein NDAI_0G01200 [Naumovozyma dairenensis CBS 421]CCD25896.2 hypothetical protein NDAI_0G01200 [Naumovozyma dairenensis CBS 421]